MREINDIVYNDLGEMLDLRLPEGDFDTVFVYFHGGGLRSGDRTAGMLFSEYLTDRGIAVVSVEYRMYPGAKFPDYLEDCADAVAFIKEHINEYGNCNKIYVGGSSAGGYISMMLCFNPEYLGKHGIDPRDITGYIHDAGQPTGHFEVIKEKGYNSKDVVVDETAPIYFLGKHGVEASPMLFIVSDNDMTCRYEQTMLMIATMKHFGFDAEKISLSVQHGTHCHYINTSDENGVSILGRIVYEFINK